MMNDQMTENFIDILEGLLCAYRKSHSCQALLSTGSRISTTTITLVPFSWFFLRLLIASLIACWYPNYMHMDWPYLLANWLQATCQTADNELKLGDARSNWATLTKAVLEGSIVGPLFFNVCINNLFYCIQNCNLCNYAADNSLSIASPSLDTVLSSLTIDGNNASGSMCMGCKPTLKNFSLCRFPL